LNEEKTKKRKRDVVEDAEKSAAIKELTGPKRKNKLLAHNPDLETVQNVPVIDIVEKSDSVETPKKRKQDKPDPGKEKKRVHVVEPTNVIEVVYDDSAPQNDDETAEEVQETPATDLEWLRARTSRTLGLVSDSEDEQSEDEISVISEGDPPVQQPETTSSTPPVTDPSDTEQPSVSNPPAAESKILKTGRLFVRNLVYGVTEEDLRNIFSPYGKIEEVSLHFHMFRKRI
jgi:multiple RNA-binding domain-containing protein 1